MSSVTVVRNVPDGAAAGDHEVDVEFDGVFDVVDAGVDVPAAWSLFCLRPRSPSSSRLPSVAHL